jgi:uncharacterized protein YukE
VLVVAELVTVDVPALQAAAATVRGLSTQVDQPLSGAVSSAVGAEATLAGSASGPALSQVAATLSPVTGDLIRALEELGRGMDEAAARFHRVDLVAGTAVANRPSGPGVGRAW